MYFIFIPLILILVLVISLRILVAYLTLCGINEQYVMYTLKHWWAYQRTAIKLKVWNPRHLLHDSDKIILRLLYGNIDAKKLQEFHRAINNHHISGRNPIAVCNFHYVDAIIDWECARVTKPDKPMDAYETLIKLYPEHETAVVPILKQLGLRYK